MPKDSTSVVVIDGPSVSEVELRVPVLLHLVAHLIESVVARGPSSEFRTLALQNLGQLRMIQADLSSAVRAA